MKRSSTGRIAELNDQLRARVGYPFSVKPGEPVLGAIVMTHRVASLAPDTLLLLTMRIRNFSYFTEENDPFGEHDFGYVPLEDGQEVFWKVDYFADASCKSGRIDPSDPNASFRVMTIMLAEEF